MSVVEPPAGAGRLADRVKAILRQPTATWGLIEAEPATIGGLYRTYVIPLALIPLVCGLIGYFTGGFGLGVLGYKPAFVAIVGGQIFGFLATLLGVFVLALIIDLLAPTFGGTRDRIQAFKVAAYAGTAGWLAGVFLILPFLAFLQILGLYSVYLLYTGLPRLMKTPREKALPYTALVLVVAVLLGFAMAGVAGAITGYGAGRIAGMGAHQEVKLPGGGSVDLGQLEAASRQLEAASRAAKDGIAAAPAVAPETLKSFVPAAIDGMARKEISSSSAAAMGLESQTVTAAYEAGERRITLTITDLGGAGALAAMAGAFNVKASEEADGRYSRVGKVDGRMTAESYDSNSGESEYSVLVGDRFMVQASGEKVPVDRLKSAVADIGLDRLAALAQSSAPR